MASANRNPPLRVQASRSVPREVEQGRLLIRQLQHINGSQTFPHINRQLARPAARCLNPSLPVTLFPVLSTSSAVDAVLLGAANSGWSVAEWMP